MTYDQALQYLYGLRQFGLKLGLEGTRALAAAVGNPQQRLQFIHVAGTNGKGSTCAFLESICRTAGLRTGLYTSPHLVSFTERIQVNRVPIQAAEVASRTAGIRDVIQAAGGEHPPTFFEVVTVLALQHFADAGCDVVIWETGLGGRLDATNIVTPLASVITQIGLDHQQWLGDTPSKIAAEKAGIIKSGVPVLTSATGPDVLEVLRRTATDLGSPWTELEPGAESRVLGDMQPSLVGSHQRRNAALAVMTVRHLTRALGEGITEAAIATGISRTVWAGRLQRVNWRNSEVWVDGAHNEDGALALSRSVQELNLGHANSTLVFGALGDKDWIRCWSILQPWFERTILLQVENDRAVPTERMLEECRRVCPDARIECGGRLRDLLLKPEIPKRLLITGSLYLVGEALDVMGLLPANPSGLERGQSDWRSNA